MCNDIIPVRTSREQAIQSSEVHHWRYRLTQKKLETAGGKMWDAILMQSGMDGYVTMVHSRPGEVVKDRARTIVRYNDAVEFMQDVPNYAMAILDWNWERDNPTQFAESQVLHEHLKNELRRLAQSRQQFLSDDLIRHMLQVGRKAFKPYVVAEKEDRLDNPVFPPGYEAYRDFLCEWVARGCFLSQNSKADLMNFIWRMKTEKGVWWIGVNLE
ncbi:hypothetical protein BDV96DRAFT_572301 [Lophiotrema nucula]|uniref:Uncharacterized protein n=1 Tax=Lophiotrema nucula TaxID=690887 RepID=A0A6A5ZBU9_9PLEO|nr:hypothetical protein BDV96DRAFT_572301 [Lophiotrema nucula]